MRVQLAFSLFPTAVAVLGLCNADGRSANRLPSVASNLAIGDAPTQRSQSSAAELDKPTEKLINGTFELGLSSWKTSADIKQRFEKDRRVVLSAADDSFLTQQALFPLFLPSFASKKTLSLPETIVIRGRAVGGSAAEIDVSLVSIASGSAVKTARVKLSSTESVHKIVWTNPDPVEKVVLRIGARTNNAEIVSASVLGREAAFAMYDATENTDFSRDFEGWFRSVDATFINGSSSEGKFVTISPVKSGKSYQEELFKHVTVPVNEGQLVRLLFSARSRTNSRMRVRYGLAEGDYAAQVDKEIQLTPEWKDYDISVISTRAFDKRKSGVSFQFSYGRGVVDMGKISIFAG